MQITLMVRFAEEVLLRLRSVVSQADLTKEDDLDQLQDSVFHGVPDGTLQAIRVRESKVVKSMNELGWKLQQSGTV